MRAQTLQLTEENSYCLAPNKVFLSYDLHLIWFHDV